MSEEASDTSGWEIQNHPLMKRLLSGGDETTVAREAVAAMLQCGPDAPLPVWRERLDACRSSAVEAGRRDIVDVLDSLKKTHQEWFGIRI